MIRATVQLILDVECEDEAADAVNEILREHQRHFAPSSCLIDYAILGHQLPTSLQANTYNEGDAFP